LKEGQQQRTKQSRETTAMQGCVQSLGSTWQTTTPPVVQQTRRMVRRRWESG